jgi:hypothetical protein
MPSISEIEANAQTALAASLRAGLETLDLNQTLTFTLYQRLVLPLDGYVFWVKASLLSSGALLNAARSPLNSAALNQGQTVVVPAPTLTVKGSVHVISDLHQEQLANFSNNRVVFTSESLVNDFNAIAPDQMYICDDFVENHRFSFSSRGSYYMQANLHHYIGSTVQSTMASQIIEDPRQINTDEVIVSNSLPAWLNINSYSPPWPVLIPFPTCPLFPSFLADLNIEPPFGTVHIDPDMTSAVQMAPSLDATMSDSQLATDRITLTLYGLNNRLARDFLLALNQYTLDTGFFGMSGIAAQAIPKDEKQTQVENLIIAQRKRYVFDVSYNQGAQRNIARQLILKAFVTVMAQDTPLGGFELVSAS